MEGGGPTHNNDSVHNTPYKTLIVDQRLIDWLIDYIWVFSVYSSPILLIHFFSWPSFSLRAFHPTSLSPPSPIQSQLYILRQFPFHSLYLVYHLSLSIGLSYHRAILELFLFVLINCIHPLIREYCVKVMMVVWQLLVHWLGYCSRCNLSADHDWKAASHHLFYRETLLLTGELKDYCKDFSIIYKEGRVFSVDVWRNQWSPDMHFILNLYTLLSDITGCN